MRLSVITVTWNSTDFILKQIESVKHAAQHIQIEQIIIDNASSDDTVSAIKREFPEVTIVANTENKGFSGANNQGVALSQGDYLLFLNPDMQLQPGSLDVFVKWMDMNPTVGIASPKLVDEQGNVNWDAAPRRFPRVWEQVALILKIPHIFPSILNGYHMRTFNFDLEQKVDSVRGSCMMMRRSLIETVGWAWDPRYFFWYEDVDICRECARNNLQVVYTPVITAIDYVGQSVKKRTTLWKQKQFTASMLIYFKKWEPRRKWIWIALFRPIGIFLAWVSEKITKH